MWLPWQSKEYQQTGSQTARRYGQNSAPLAFCNRWMCCLDGPYNSPHSLQVWSMTPGLNYWNPGWRHWVAPSQAL